MQPVSVQRLVLNSASQPLNANASPRQAAVDTQVLLPRARNRSPSPIHSETENGPLKVADLMKIPRVYPFDLNENETECGVCYENFGDRRIIRRLKCKHSFHQICVFEWFKKASTCPLCRANLVQAEN